ncbi:hypothetical protein SAICODRAFT_32196 [Saitoella complicata NRRL Y-17804]|uniref:uncharacterized protein n=1 Tax=Saitoella complicata (strain BCRC 22490 / CBS 7301 / JCM 7358 / NBRC 10748 / NRRL Y-17804) TaxID=698492 RepID=UPI00086683F7|nr:uncharacterized protein SAICODRAFT_32196 [Saitoella complicata NRRL Y-17804]ODQ49846.1 hypothetical protein SAICODRAFT_32196 [Saitoella complicata NRRL Y-17804]
MSFGFLATLPTDNVDAALEEVERWEKGVERIKADGYAVTCRYNGVYLSDSSFDSLRTKLNELGATVFAHPDAYAPSDLGRPAPLLEVAFETARTIVDMLYANTTARSPNTQWVSRMLEVPYHRSPVGYSD